MRGLLSSSGTGSWGLEMGYGGMFGYLQFSSFPCSMRFRLFRTIALVSHIIKSCVTDREYFVKTFMNVGTLSLHQCLGKHVMLGLGSQLFYP